jgi:hypothetical protein
MSRHTRRGMGGSPLAPPPKCSAIEHTPAVGVSTERPVLRRTTFPPSGRPEKRSAACVHCRKRHARRCCLPVLSVFYQMGAAPRRQRAVTPRSVRGEQHGRPAHVHVERR